MSSKEAKYSCSVLDVGQGSMQLFEEGDKGNIIFDCNIAGANEFILRYLGRRKVNHVDLLVLSGTDQDHADADGLEMLWNRFGTDIREVWYPDFPQDTDNWKRVKKILKKMQEAGVKMRNPMAGDEAVIGSIKIKVLSPHPNDSDTSNNASIVVKMTAGQGGYLFPGDCESENRWGNILKYFRAYLPSDFLLAAHHGSKNGCVEEVVKEINPRFTVISCGEDNPHGHPDEEALKIYRKYTRERIFITYEDKTVLFEADAKEIINYVTDAGQDDEGKKASEALKRASLLGAPVTVPRLEFPNRPLQPNKPRGYA